MDKKYWTNFDLLDAVKRISSQNGLSYLNKGHEVVAEEILNELGELSIDSSQSEEDKKLISNFKMKYFRVVKKFKPYRNKFDSPAIQEYGLQIFWKIEKKISAVIMKKL